MHGALLNGSLVIRVAPCAGKRSVNCLWEVLRGKEKGWVSLVSLVSLACNWGNLHRSGVQSLYIIYPIYV